MKNSDYQQAKNMYTSYVTLVVNNEFDFINSDQITLEKIDEKSEYQVVSEVVESVIEHRNDLRVDDWECKLDVKARIPNFFC